MAAPVPLCSADGHRADSSQFYSPSGSEAPAGSEGNTGGPGGGCFLQEQWTRLCLVLRAAGAGS